MKCITAPWKIVTYVHNTTAKKQKKNKTLN